MTSYFRACVTHRIECIESCSHSKPRGMVQIVHVHVHTNVSTYPD